MKLTKNITKRYLSEKIPQHTYCIDSITTAINSISQVYKVDSIQVLEYIFEERKEIDSMTLNMDNFLNNFGNLYYFVKRGLSPDKYWREFLD